MDDNRLEDVAMTCSGETASEQLASTDQPALCTDVSLESAATSAVSVNHITDLDYEANEGSIRHRRPKRRNVPAASPLSCPVCGVTLRPAELEQHWLLELGRLHGIARNVARRHRLDSSSTGCANGTRGPRWEALRRVRLNRRRRKGPATGVHCPVCHEALRGTPDELAEHVDRCLARTEYDDDESEDVDVDGTEACGSGGGSSESFDEYEWAGQVRLRATALLEGGFRAAGWVTAGSSSSTSARNTSATIDDEDLDVDGDDADTFGRPQFLEADLIPLESSEPSEERDRRRLRQALLLAQDGVGRSSSPPRRDEDVVSAEKPESPTAVEGRVPDGKTAAESATGEAVPKGALSHVVTSLQERLRQLEERHSDSTKCLICMEPYTKPVVSVCCWHVHCQDCWLKTLGAKKLCPQCNSITGAGDLRRIYL